MEQISFEDIYLLGQVVRETELYRHYHYPEMLARYDSNFIEFKRMPNLEEFKESVNYLREFHQKNGQKHIKFVFPENEKLTADIFFHLIGEDFNMGVMELYAIEPGDFPRVEDSLDIEVQEVTEENLETYLNLQYDQDLKFGSEFAYQKVEQHKQHFQQDNILQVLATYKGTAVGSVDIIEKENTAEIDGLAVEESHQRKGIGSRLQKFVMDRFPDKIIILVADGEDSPREMYKKQNYQYMGFRHEVQKIYQT